MGGAGVAAGQGVERAQVGGADVPGAQQAHEAVPPLGVRGGGDEGAQVGDLGDAEHPADADDLVGDAALLEGVDDGGELGARAGQDGELGARPPATLHEVGHRLGLGEGVGQEGGVDGALGEPGGGGAGGEARDGDVLDGGVPALGVVGAQGGGDDVGGVEDALVIAPGRGQGQDGRGARGIRPGCRGLGARGVEAGVEGVQGPGAGPAPPVDRLVRVPDGGDASPGEEAGQQEGLGHGGVLELVEEDGGVLLAEGAGGAGDLVDDPAGQGDLVPEVDEPVAALVLAVLGGEVEEGPLGGHRPGLALEETGQASDAGQAREELVEVLQSLGRVLDAEQVLRQGTVDAQDGAHGGGGGVEGERRGALGEQVVDDLPGAGGGDEGGVGVDADAQAVVPHEGGGEGVVGGDRRLAELGGVGGTATGLASAGQEAGVGELAEAGGHA